MIGNKETGYSYILFLFIIYCKPVYNKISISCRDI